MLHIQKIIGFLFLITLFSSCYKDDVVSTETIDLISAERIYLNTIEGQVLDTLGEPIASVLIEMGEETAMTDGDGRFTIIDVMIPSSGEFILATHPNYYEGGIRVYASAPIVQNVQINLVPKGTSQNFNSAQGATLNVADLAQVIIPPNAFTKDNNAYAGMVTMEVYLVNPNEARSYNKRIQVFEACACTSPIFTGAETILKSDLNSIMYVEAYDESGNELTVAPDRNIQIKLPTYGASDLFTPTLFSFDEKIGFWKNENETTVNGSFYDVELSHFSWWGVGTAKVASDLCITFTNANPQEDHLYTVSSTTGKTLQVGGITYDAKNCFVAPSGETLEIRVFNACFKEIFATSITTGSAPDIEVSIDVESTSDEGYLVEIEIVDCDYTTFQDSVTVYYFTDLSLDSLPRGVGTFDLTLDECFRPEELAIAAIHTVGNMQYSYGEIVKINENQRQYNIQIVACQDVMSSEGQLLTFNGITYSNVIARQNPQETLIIAEEGSDSEVVIGFDGFETGRFDARFVSFQSNIFCEGEVEIISYGEVGEFIIGEFQIPDFAAQGCEPLSGEFRAKREK